MLFILLLPILSATAAIQVRSEGASGSDVKKIERSLNAVENTAERMLGDRYPELKTSIVCEVIVYGAETEKANSGTATLESSGRDGKLYGTLHILASSKYPKDLRSIGGQDKASDEYTLRLLGHEVLSLYLEALSRTRAKGWAYYSAPSWFMQGAQEYVASLCLNDISRTNIFENYHRSVEIKIGPQITVSNPYSGGLVIMTFVAEQYGKEKILQIIASEEETFDQAFEAILGPREAFQQNFIKWSQRKKMR
ncbi:MAG TPA: hypothetical protein VIM57_03110 [Luteolibacter sp.]